MRELTAKEVEQIEQEYNELKSDQARGVHGIHDKLLMMEERYRQCGYRFTYHLESWKLIEQKTGVALREDGKWRPPGLGRSVNNRRHFMDGNAGK